MISALYLSQMCGDEMNLTNIGHEIRKYEKDIITDIQRLIGIRSVKEPPLPGKPYGPGIAEALDYMLALGERMGFRSRNVDGYAGHIDFGDGEEIVAVLVHLDTVAEGKGWSVDPLGGVISNGLIIGRGASDNKGPAVVALYALAALRDRIARPGRRLRIIFGTDEESGMSDMDYYFSKEPLPVYSFTPDASYPIIHAEKGYLVLTVKEKAPRSPSPIIQMAGGDAANVVPDRCEVLLADTWSDKRVVEGWLEAASEESTIQCQAVSKGIQITCHGKSGHGSYPPSGVNAIVKLIDLLTESRTTLWKKSSLLSFIHERIGEEAFGESLGIACQDPKHGRLTVNLASVAIDTLKAQAVFNIRYPVTEDAEPLLKRLQDQLEGYGLEMSVDHHMPPLHIPEDHPLISKLGRAYTTVMGEPARLLSIGGGTYARKLRNTGVAFGAGFPGRNHGPGPHQPDECVSIEDLMQHGEICTQALFELQHKGDEDDE
jgi:succinyl-diaminopimelate desuccinylase